MRLAIRMELDGPFLLPFSWRSTSPMPMAKSQLFIACLSDVCSVNPEFSWLNQVKSFKAVDFVTWLIKS